jgi:hypothetical protein
MLPKWQMDWISVLALLSFVGILTAILMMQRSTVPKVAKMAGSVIAIAIS